jgi:hypothetical protein
LAKTQPPSTSANAILSQLSRQDFQLLQPHLSPVDLPVRRQLTTRSKRVEDVYFIETGIASVVGAGSGNRSRSASLALKG